MDKNKLNDILAHREEANASDSVNKQLHNKFFPERVLRIIANVILAIGIVAGTILFSAILFVGYFGVDTLTDIIIPCISTIIGSLILWAFFHVICNISEGINKLNSRNTKFKKEE